MSKAFTKEDASPEPEPRRPPVRLGPGERRYVTQEGFAEMSADLARLAPEHPRAQELAQLLPLLTVVEAGADNSGGVHFGAYVGLEDPDGARRRYRIVGPDEADPRRGLLSVDSPLARALLGKRQGDTVEIRAPGGVVEWTLTSVAAA